MSMPIIRVVMIVLYPIYHNFDILGVVVHVVSDNIGSLPFLKIIVCLV